MSKRKSIPSGIRFEVFKRDKFTCQYCGRRGPDVVLHIDHIEPVSKGGTNDIMNLVTSCVDCNLGKGDRKLSDDTAISKQRDEMELIAERKEQLDMLARWKMELLGLNDEEVTVVSDYFSKLTGHSLTNHGKSGMRDRIKKYGVAEVLDSIEIAYSKYWDRDQENHQKFFSMLNGILRNRKRARDDPQYGAACELATKAMYKYQCGFKAPFDYIYEVIQGGVVSEIISQVIDRSEDYESFAYGLGNADFYRDHQGRKASNA